MNRCLRHVGTINPPQTFNLYFASRSYCLDIDNKHICMQQILKFGHWAIASSRISPFEIQHSIFASRVPSPAKHFRKKKKKRQEGRGNQSVLFSSNIILPPYLSKDPSILRTSSSDPTTPLCRSQPIAHTPLSQHRNKILATLHVKMRGKSS